MARENFKFLEGVIMKETQYSRLKNKLVFKLPFRIILAVFAALVALGVTLDIRLSQSTEQLANEKVDTLAQNNAYLVSSYFNAMQTISSDLSQEVSQLHSLDDYEKDSIIKEALGTLVDDKRIFSAYVALEPNTLFKNTPAGLSYYEYHDGSKKKMDVLNDYADYKDGEYYAVSKKNLKPHITEPYSYKLTSGQTVWLITISNPILDKTGKFLGVANADILTDTINGLSYSTGEYATAHNYILTANSNYVVDTADKKKSGTKFTANHDDGLIQITRPLNINGIDEKWTSTFGVQKAETLQPTVALMLTVGILGTLALLLIGLFVFFMMRKSLSPVEKIVELSRSMGNGNLHSDIKVNTDDELGELARISKETADRLNEYISEISDTLEQVADGDLNATVKRDYVGDFAPIKKALLTIVSSFNGAFSEIDTAAEQVALGSGQVSNGAQALAQGATEQAASVEELSATVSEIADQVRQNAENASHADAKMQEVRTEIETSSRHMEKMVAAMAQIDDSSDKIGKIIQTIDDIAFQTNILALNAAVEAARAGEAGKGFAVVADEVRNLAGKSAQAAKDTTSLIEASLKQVAEGTRIADETAKALSQAVESVAEVSQKVGQISKASVQQSDAVGQVTLGMEQISTVVQTNSATAEESSAASEELSGQARMLKALVARFKINRAAAD